MAMKELKESIDFFVNITIFLLLYTVYKLHILYTISYLLDSTNMIIQLLYYILSGFSCIVYIL